MKAKLFSFYLRQKWNQVLTNQADPMSAQQRAFEKLQAKLKGTKIAQKSKLNMFSSFEAFISSTPVSTYKDIGDLVEEQLSDPSSKALFHDDVKFIGLSSGTTAATAKKIPFSESVL